MTKPAERRKLAAIVSADVQGYSRLMGDDEDATVETITAYRAVFDQVRKKLDFGFAYMGRVGVKNISEPVRVYRLLASPEDAGRFIDEEAAAPKEVDSRAACIAVLPFENFSAAGEPDYFSLGFAEDLITDLSHFPSLQVISFYTSRKIGAEARDAIKEAEKLGIGYLLKGNLRRQEDQLRISVQLLEVDSGTILWGERYDESMERVFQLQDDIVARVVSAISAQIDRVLLAAARKKPLTSLAAYDCWLRGMDQLRQGTSEADREARKIFQQAIDIDPNYSRAYAGISLSYFNDWSCQLWSEYEATEKNAYEYASKAVRLDDTDYIVHLHRKVDSYALWVNAGNIGKRCCRSNLIASIRRIAMNTHRNELPQTTGQPFITDGGLETTLHFNSDFDLPEFAAFDLFRQTGGYEALREYYLPYIDIAEARGTGFILESPTWRASLDWGRKLGYTRADLSALNRKSISMLQEIRSLRASDGIPMVISGCIGPRGDGYQPLEKMAAGEAERYHREQIEALKAAGADLVTAFTLTYVEEAVGITRAARSAKIPAVISFTLETDGRLPSGMHIGDALEAVDEATGSGPAYYMINCAHPSHFTDALAPDAAWSRRIRAIRANASTKSHAELDQAETLDAGDPVDLGARYAALKSRLPHLTVFGGCCGTDLRHIEEIAGAVTEH